MSKSSPDSPGPKPPRTPPHGTAIPTSSDDYEAVIEPTTSTVILREPESDSLRKRRNKVFIASFALVIVAAMTTVLLTILQEKSLAFLAVFNLNLLVIFGLLLVIARNLAKVYFQRNTKFRSKLVFAFVMASIIPTVILFFLGTGILNEAMNRWFNPKVEVLVNDAREIVVTFVAAERERLENAINQVRTFLPYGEGLSKANEEALQRQIDDLRRFLNVDSIQIFLVDETEWIRVSNNLRNHQPQFFQKPRILLAGCRSSGEVVFNQEELPAGASLQVALPIMQGPGPFSEDRIFGFLVVRRFVPGGLYSQIQQITRTREAYMESQFTTTQFRWTFLMIFITLTAVLLLSAVWFGTNLAKEIARPVQILADATEQVAQGNLAVEVDISSAHEFNTLVASFNSMTRQIRESREAINAAQEELLAKNQALAEKQLYIETLLQDIPNGVISLDHEGYITTMNHGASQLLNLRSDEVLGKHASEVFAEQPIDRLRFWIDQIRDYQIGTLKRQLNLKSGEDNLYLDVTLSSFRDPITDAQGYLVVLEDLSELLKAQRAAAWQEVARRIAHEIKNPLTPITVAAGQIKRKLEKDDPNLLESLPAHLRTILESSHEIQLLTNEFTEFARLPEATPQPANLHAVIQGTLDLYEGVYPNVVFKTEFYPPMPQVNLDTEQMRRALRNLIDNGIQAMDERGTLTISTEHDSYLQTARIIIADEGAGIRPEDRDKLFVPYFSTKGEKGTGLGLAIVNKIISDHNGYIRVRDNQPKGTRVIIELPTGYSVATSWRAK